jgi:hypothetical protein
MSQKSRFIFGAAAIALTLGAIPLAAGRDLSADVLGGFQGSMQGSVQGSDGTPASAVNRTGKADRAAAVARSETPTQTILLRLDGLSDTSVLLRVPVAQAMSPASSAPSWTQSGKRAVACEPVVSVLTEIAGKLQPGRCVT